MGCRPRPDLTPGTSLGNTAARGSPGGEAMRGHGRNGDMNMIDILIAGVTLATCTFTYLALERIERTR